jgi:hypothetical protein
MIGPFIGIESNSLLDEVEKATAPWWTGGSWRKELQPVIKRSEGCHSEDERKLLAQRAGPGVAAYGDFGKGTTVIPNPTPFRGDGGEGSDSHGGVK